MRSQFFRIDRERREKRPPLNIRQASLALVAIEHTLNWLDRHQVCHRGFGFGPQGAEILAVACPTLYMLAKGAAERCGIEQVGAYCFEVWSFRNKEGVEIFWQEVVCVH